MFLGETFEERANTICAVIAGNTSIFVPIFEEHVLNKKCKMRSCCICRMNFVLGGNLKRLNQIGIQGVPNARGCLKMQGCG